MTSAIILVVDDDQSTVLFCKRLLERASYQVVGVSNPLDGLKELRKGHIDLLLADIYMPEIDGFELIQQAKQLQPDLPALVMTGYGSIENAIKALNRGANGLIIKPIERAADLVLSVNRIISENQQKLDASRSLALRPLLDLTEDLLTETSSPKLEKLILSRIKDLLNSPISIIYQFSDTVNNLASNSFLVDAGETSIDLAVVKELISTLCTDDGPKVVLTGQLDSNANIAFETQKIGSIIVAPVHRKNRVFFYALRYKHQQYFTDADLEMLVILARQAAIALENAQLYSELRENIRRVEESQLALVQMEKMAAVGRLVASIAHEINNPLQAVRNCLNLAARSNLSNDQRFQYLNMMDIELDRLTNTVKQMLDYYRPGRDDKELVDIYQIVNQVLDLLKPQFHSQNIQVHVKSLVKKCGKVSVVPGQIQQVLFNLLINSIESIQEKHYGSNYTSNGKEDIWINISANGSYVSILVEDSGQGVSQEISKHMFEPFMSTKQKGTGMGLTVSYGIIERHNGSLSLVSSRNGKGACFEVRLPLEGGRNNGKNITR